MPTVGANKFISFWTMFLPVMVIQFFLPAQGKIIDSRNSKNETHLSSFKLFESLELI
jgi:hypothetical protein